MALRLAVRLNWAQPDRVGPGGQAMGEPTTGGELQVIVDKDALCAELSIPNVICAEQFTVEALVEVLTSVQVEITDAVRTALEELVANPPGKDQPHRVKVAVAMAPIHGTDGHLEWLVEEEHRPPVQPDGSISFYEQSAYTMVSAEQIIGRIVPPTDGEEGRNVLGQPIPCKKGQPIDPRFDETIVVNGAAELVAQIDGVFLREGPRATIRATLEVPGYVDFSTGNIDFHGNVIVRKGVRDLFHIRSTGGIDIKGLVEAATLDCDEDLVLAGGMAGREHGLIRCKSNVIARHLNGTRLEVQGDLLFEKEMINCNATVRGSVKSPKGAIIGGTLDGARDLEVAVLGSSAGVDTTLQLGSLSLLRARVCKLDDVVQQLGYVLKALLQQREQLVPAAKRRQPGGLDRLAKVIDDIRNVDEQMKEAQRKRDEVAAQIEMLLAFKVTITGMLHAGVIFAISRQPLRVFMDVIGPLIITIAESGQVLVHPDGAAVIPIEKITRPHSATAATAA